MRILKKLSFLFIVGLLFTTSCRQEDEEIIDPPVEEAIAANSTIATLLGDVSRSDGSFDNIIDQSSCFSIQLPVMVIVNGIELEINTPDDYQTIEDIFEQSDADTDTLEIVFPVMIIFDDYSTQLINSYPELLAVIAQCPDENSDDDDIECIDIQYPITAAIFNANNEQIDTIVITNDFELFQFIQNLPNYDAVTISFPITVIFADGTTMQVTSLQELQQVIEQASDDCDEDDDNDYDDDDCPNCTTSELTDVLTNCPAWRIDELERNDNDLEDQYIAYTFVFNENGSLTATTTSGDTVGTWSAMGEGNNIQVVINIPGLPDINDTWNLNEIEQEGSEVEVELRLGDDKLEFECGDDDDDDDPNDDCNNCTTEGLTQLLVDCSEWQVDKLERNDEDLENQYVGYDFDFFTNGDLMVDNGASQFTGTWSASGSGNNISVVIAVTGLPDINDTWQLHSLDDGPAEYQVDLRIGEDRLRFESDCQNGTGGGDDDLTDALTADNSIWIVDSYMEDNDDQTANYNGYQFEFDTNGTITVSGAEMSTGTWASLSNGTEMLIDFGPEAPLEELNDEDWEVLSVTSTEVQLRDVSGGGGGTDLLTLVRL